MAADVTAGSAPLLAPTCETTAGTVAQAAEDKTFGLKNKNKSAKVAKYGSSPPCTIAQ